MAEHYMGKAKQMGSAPECITKYHPTSGGYAGGAIEGEGAVGEKEPMPSGMGSMASDDGYHDIAAHTAFNAQHGWPAPAKDPDNATGSIDDYSDNPTKGEGSKNTY